MITLTLSFMLAISVSFILAQTPLMMGMWVLLLALSVALLLSHIYMSWLGMMVFLIYIGGMLVMFAYFIAIQPNQYFKSAHIVSFPLSLLVGLKYMSSTAPPMLNMPLANSLIMLYSFYNIPLLLVLGLLLFLALLMVVKIAKSSYGPLRPSKHLYD